MRLKDYLHPADATKPPRRALLFAVALMTVIEVVVVVTQLDYYRTLKGMSPQVFGWSVRVYLAVPVITGALSLYFATLSSAVIDVNRGRYRLYLRLMWFFAAVAAAVNAIHSWEHIGDNTHATALVLGALSLCSPLVWHTYAAFRIAVALDGYSIADVAKIARQWVRHPVFTIKCGYTLDLFPDMTREQVWEHVTARKRAKIAAKWAAAPVAVDVAAVDAAPVNRVEVPAPRVNRVDAPAVERRDLNPNRIDRELVDLEALFTREPAVTSAVNAAAPVEPVKREPVNNTADSAGEPRRTLLIIAEWFDRQEAAPGTALRSQAAIARERGCSAAYVSKVFTACARGEHADPRPVDDDVTDAVAVGVNTGELS